MSDVAERRVMTNVSEETVQEVAAVLSSMSPEDRARIAKLLHIPAAELDRVIVNWKADRQ